MDLQDVLDEIAIEVRPLLGRGKVADYIPELAGVDPQRFAMAVQTAEGEIHQVGEAEEPFSAQSVSKLFTLTLAMRYEGDRLWRRVGREPSGTAFNSLVQLESESGVPRNPFINAGALVVTDVLLSRCGDALGEVLALARDLSGNAGVSYDPAVALSELATGHRNAALAYFLKSFSNLDNAAPAVLETYCHHCSLAMSCVDLARAAFFLANGGRTLSGELITSPNQAKYINSLLLTCGVYDAAGDFAYRVGLPAKSGVGGGIVAVMPGAFSACVWSPGLNENGNSLAGTHALELFTTKTGMSIF
ncbi:MAG: glutaminase [Acidobacteria bacterium]|nr:glutaminase [Acidobacteriota bacterium]